MIRSQFPIRALAPIAVFLSLALAANSAAAAGQAFKLFLENAGAYRVTFEQLADAGLSDESVPSAGLGLATAGRAVPIWVEDGGDGHFGAGDWIEFLGEHLPGQVSFLNEYTRFNVYTLHLDEAEPLRMSVAGAAPATPGADVHAVRRRQHLERDQLILRLPVNAKEEPEELWYWAKLVHGRQPFEIDLDLRDLAPTGAVELRLGFRGWSNPRAKKAPEVADHTVHVSLGETRVASAEWQGTEPFELTVPSLDAGSLVQGGNRLELEIPKRMDGPDGKLLVDVVMLNWIEVSYPRAPEVGEWQARFELEEPSSERAIHLRGQADRPLLLYGTGGSRAKLAATEGEPSQVADYRVSPAAGESVFFASRLEQLWSPDAVALDEPSNLAASENRADYLIIAHRKLLAAVLPLAAMHRERGLEVAVIDVEDVYDEFHHGVAHPQALRDFLEHAYDNWARPAPRFVLLVGDASWDGKNATVKDENYADWTFRPNESTRFIKNRSTAYAEGAGLNNRNLIPTFNHATSQGHSASDNYFVAFGDDHLPKIAIGRLPVIEPAEVAGIVEKTIQYVTRPEVGPWRRNALLITNESRGFQNQSDRIATALSADGFAAHKIYPASTETSNERHSAHLIESFDEGQLFVHFLGHGGRYIWRTGPPDLDKNHDLFTLEHLDQLEPNDRLPVVISLTCYSAPFDHPSADSIGEKLLRLDGRGAVAVFAASWRNSPSSRWGRELFAELTREGVTVGEAIVRAKATLRDRLFVETYNLLGDPALPVALPAADIALEASLDGGALAVRGIVDLPEFTGEAVVDLVGDDGEILSTQAFEVRGRELSARLEASAAQLAALRTVRAYAWSQPRGVDAVGAVALGPLVASTAAPAAAAAGTDK